MTFTLSYLFYAGIIVPTVVTLALFVFFVICWRKQSARKAVLTKPYDPHGTMRRLGIPNRPPPPPVFVQHALRLPPGSHAGSHIYEDEEEGGEDNAAYDMSRSPSAEANTGGGQGGGNTNNRAGPHLGLHHLQQYYGHNQHHHSHHHPQLNLTPHLSSPSSPITETYCCNHAAAAAAAAAALTASNAGSPIGGQRMEFHSSPSGELDITGRLTFHSRLDSGLSEPACDSPGACSNRGGGGGIDAGGGGGGGGGGGMQQQQQHQQQQQQPQPQPPRDRPQSQASHSSHSTDSEDSGFRSSRSGQFVQTSAVAPEPPVLKRSRSAGRGVRGGAGGRGFYHKAATSSPESETEPCIQLTPTALWPHHHTHHTHHPIPTHPHPASNPHSPLHGDDTSVKNTGVDLGDIGTHIGWKYLQDLTSSGQQRGNAAGGGGGGSGGATTTGASSGLPAGLRQTLTCHQSMTMAQVHNPRELDNPDVFGFSVV